MSKYGNIKVTVDGIKFDSIREASRYNELKMLEKAGKISGLRMQVKYQLFPKTVYGRELRYIADFVYTDFDTGQTVVEDVKGVKTAVYKLKRRMMAEKYGIIIKET